MEEAIAFADVVFLAVPYGAMPKRSAATTARRSRARSCSTAAMPSPARDGAIADVADREGIGLTSQRLLPGARLVRAFNTIGYTILASEAGRPDPRLPIPIAGDDAEAVKVAAGLVQRGRLRAGRRRRSRRGASLPARRARLRPERERGRTAAKAARGAVTAPSGRLRGLMPATPAERRAALWSFAYFFALLASYYVLRPLRDQSAIAGGIKALPWLFTATFATLLVAQPVYGALVARLPRRRFIVVVYHFFAANLALFWLLLVLGIEPVAVARVFFVWVSVFNLFAVAVFWSFMADLFDSAQGKRLFGFIGAGGTAGALLGPVLTIALSEPLGPANLLLVALRAARGRGALRAPARAHHHGRRRPATRGARGRRQRLLGVQRSRALALPARHRALG